MILSLVTPPVAEPLTVEELRQHVRADGTAEDDWLAGAVAAARAEFEARTGRQVMRATWRLVLDRFPRAGQALHIPRPPLSSVASVKYLDSAGVEQTWSSDEYSVLAPQGAYAQPGILYPKPTFVWPATYPVHGAVTVEFLAGYVDAAAVPEPIKSVLRQIVADLYLNRESTVSGGAVVSPTHAEMLSGFRLLVYA